MAGEPPFGSDEWAALNGPVHLRQAYADRAAMDPDDRKLDLEARKAEADAKRIAELRGFNGQMIEQKGLELKIAERQLETEKVKKRREDTVPLADPNSISLEFATMADTATVSINYLLDPYLPEKCVVGFYGRGSTSKSSFVASMAAHASGVAATLWVSVEEPADWIKVRHIKAGGADNTLQVVKAVAIKQDGQGRTVGSSFNIYEHLEPAIVAAKVKLLNVQGGKPLKLVVLDTAVGLTTWTASAGPNSDEGVKRLLAYLQGLAEFHALTIAIIGHANKGTCRCARRDRRCACGRYASGWFGFEQDCATPQGTDRAGAVYSVGHGAAFRSGAPDFAGGG